MLSRVAPRLIGPRASAETEAVRHVDSNPIAQHTAPECARRSGDVRHPLKE